MSTTTTALQNAATLESLEEYYDSRTIDLCIAGDKDVRGLESGEVKPGTIRAARAVAGPAAYEAAKKCQDLARQLIEAHAELVATTREWRRLA